jgi:uncharacterized protein
MEMTKKNTAKVATSISKEQIRLLVEIQEIGTQKDIALAKIAGSPSKLAALDNEVEIFQAALDELETRSGELKKKYRENESEARNEQSREKKKQEQLRAVKTNKEYQSILKEIADLKKKISGMEDEMLLILDEQETLESTLAQKRREKETLVGRVDGDRQAIELELESYRRKVAELDERMNEIGKKIDGSLFNKYAWVRGRVGRTAIVPVKKAVCQGCHLNIPPQMFNELQRCDKLEFCPHCQRIIYWNDGSEQSGRSPDRPKGGSEESPNTEGQGAP